MNRAVPVASSPDTIAGVIATLQFTVLRPVSINRKYGKSPKRGGQLFLTSEYRGFTYRANLAVFDARARCPEWPSDPWRAADVTLSYQLFDVKLDADSVRKPLRDACEGILYWNDRVVNDGPAPRAIKDGLGARVVVTVTLNAIRTEAEAADLQRAHHNGVIARLKRKAKAV